MKGMLLFLLCVGIFANDALAFPTEGLPRPKPIENPNRCLLLTPDREAQVEIAVERLTQFIHNLTEELELIDLKYLNIVIDGHYDDEIEDREMVLELTVNSCPRTDVKVADDAIDVDDGVKELEGEVNGEKQEEEDHKDVGERDDGDNNEDTKVIHDYGETVRYNDTENDEKSDTNGIEVRDENEETDSIVDGKIYVVNGDVDVTANDEIPILERKEEIKFETNQIKQPHHHKNHHGHKHVENNTSNEETLISDEPDHIHHQNHHSHKHESVKNESANDKEAKDQSDQNHHNHRRSHHSHRHENVDVAETRNDDVHDRDIPVEIHHHRAYHDHSDHDDKQVQNNAHVSEFEDSSNTEINDDVTKAQNDNKSEITKNRAEIFVNANKSSYIITSELDNIPKLCYCTEIQPQDLPQKPPKSNIENTSEELDSLNKTIEFNQDIAPELFELQLPDNGVELLKEISKKTSNGPVLVYVQNWDDVKNRQYVIFSN